MNFGLDVAVSVSTLEACTSRISAGPGSVEDPLTHYIVVRRDLPRGSAAAQIVHAAGESSPGNLEEGTYAVVLGARNELELAALEQRLKAAGVAHKAIREPIMGNSLTAIGAVPAPRSTIRRWFSNLPLYR